MKAMVFDDDALIRLLLCEMLRQRGYEVTSFSDPAFCPLIEDEKCPHPNDEPCADVIVTDLKMPKVNGLDFVETQLRKGCKCRHIALISGYWSQADLRRAKQLRVKILEKPFYAKEINAWLDEVDRDSGADSPHHLPPDT